MTSETAPTTPTPQESAFSRLQEFPSDPVASAEQSGREHRMDEMEAWANGIGAHTERRAVAHRTVTDQIIDSGTRGNAGPDVIKTRLRNVSSWRTGVKVHDNGDVEVHDQYPYSGDTPAGTWHKYRSPKNIRNSN